MRASETSCSTVDTSVPKRDIGRFHEEVSHECVLCLFVASSVCFDCVRVKRYALALRSWNVARGPLSVLCMLCIVCYVLCYLSCVMCYLLCVMCYVLCYILCGMCYVLCDIYIYSM